jgi:DNA-binding transcriptional MerR regulator
LPKPRRTSGNYRSYAADHLQRLGFIRRARELGFSIEDVRELLKLAANSERPCEEVDQLVARHLETTERKIEALTRLRRELRGTSKSCKGGRVAECRVIQALSPVAANQKRKA